MAIFTVFKDGRQLTLNADDVVVSNSLAAGSQTYVVTRGGRKYRLKADKVELASKAKTAETRKSPSMLALLSQTGDGAVTLCIPVALCLYAIQYYGIEPWLRTIGKGIDSDTMLIISVCGAVAVAALAGWRGIFEPVICSDAEYYGGEAARISQHLHK